MFLASKLEAEVVVGSAGKLMAALHSVLPGLVETMMSEEVDTVQMHKSPPAEDSSHSLHSPTNEGTGVYGGRLNE